MVAIATLTVTELVADETLLLVYVFIIIFPPKWLRVSCFCSCCLESLSGHRPPSQTAVLHTKPKMTGWVRNCYWTQPAMYNIITWCWTWFTPVSSESCLQGSTWTLIDLPGHDSLRPQYLEKFKSAARWEQDTPVCCMFICLCLTSCAIKIINSELAVVIYVTLINHFVICSCHWV